MIRNPQDPILIIKAPTLPIGSLVSTSCLGSPYRILNINHKKELLRSLWVNPECRNRRIPNTPDEPRCPAARDYNPKRLNSNSKGDFGGTGRASMGSDHVYFCANTVRGILWVL